MNKKFSTLVAVLLAAGSFVTIDALVNVLDNKKAPKAGESYTIGTKLDRADLATLLAFSGDLTSESSELSGVAGVAAAAEEGLKSEVSAEPTTFADCSHWKLVGSLESFKLAYVTPAKGLRYLAADADGGLSLVKEEVVTKGDEPVEAPEILSFTLDGSHNLTILGEGTHAGKQLSLGETVVLAEAPRESAAAFALRSASATPLFFIPEEVEEPALKSEYVMPTIGTEYAIATAAALANEGTKILTNTFVEANYALALAKEVSVDAETPLWTVKAADGDGFTLMNAAGARVVVLNGKLALVPAESEQASAVFTYVNGELVTTIGDEAKEVKADDFTLTEATAKAENEVSFGQWIDDAGAPIEAAPTATTPIMIRLGANYLVLGQDAEEKTVVTTKAAATYDLTVAANVSAATWYVEDGLIKSFANGKYLAAVLPAPTKAATPDEAAAGFTLVDTKAEATTFKAYTAATTATPDFSKMTKLGFENAGTPMFFTAAGATEATYNTAAASHLTITSVPTPINDKVVTSIVADDYYLLATGVDKYIASTDGQTVVGPTGVAHAGLKALWKVTETARNGGFDYTFTNAEGDALKLNGSGNFTSATLFSYAQQQGALQLTLNGKNIVADNTGKISAEQNGLPLAVFGLYTAPEAALNGKYLTDVLGGGFDLTIAMKSDYTDTEIESNPFNGILTPMKLAVKELVAANAATDVNYFLKNAAGDYIVLDTKSAWSSSQDGMNGANNYNRGYKFTTLSEDDFLKMLNGTDKEATDMQAQYKYNFSLTCKGDPNKAVKALYINVLNKNISTFGKVYAASFNDENVLTTSNRLNTVDGRVENWPFIKFGGNGLVPSATFFGKAVNVAYVHNGAHGQAKNNQDYTTAGRRVDGNWVPVDTTYTQFNKPEGQWMVSKSDNAGEFTLVNRESQTTVQITGLYTTPVSNVYAAVKVAGTAAANAMNNVSDTLQITLAPAYDEFTGYANFDTTSLKVKTFTIAVATVLDGKVYSTEPDNGHKIGLSKDADEAAQWRLIKFELGKIKNKLYNKAENDTIKSAIDLYKDGKLVKGSTDSLYAFAYAFRNDATNEFLKYDADKRAYIVDKDSKNFTEKDYDNVQKFILKEERDDTYQIIPTDIESETSIPTDSKLYGAFSELKIDQTQKDIYDITNNDLFAIDDVNAPLYIGAANAPELSFTDTIKVFKEENNKVVMYERGNFLGMQHVADVEKMAPAMFVDTAYVRYNTYKPQYLLSVRDTLIYHDANCPIPGHPDVAPTMVDTVKASYLVNMVDSAKAFGLDKHNNPYIWENTVSFKLAFVNGYHTNDSLYFAKKDAKNAVVKDAKGNIVYDRIFLGNNENRIGKYAFRIVDKATNAFIIETSYDGTNKIGYIKWLNGTPAVIEDRTQAEVFNMLKTKENPTDNEGIQTTEVSVIAGAGQVVINNAAGKVVAISNILGQTIANTVITSDNATIAVPAGIVVVAIEGEAAVKAIVK